MRSAWSDRSGFPAGRSVLRFGMHKILLLPKRFRPSQMPGMRLTRYLLRRVQLVERGFRPVQLQIGISQSQMRFAIIRLQL